MTLTEATRYLSTSPRGKFALRSLEGFLTSHEEHGLTPDQCAAVVELTRRFFNGYEKSTLEFIRAQRAAQ